MNLYLLVLSSFSLYDMYKTFPLKFNVALMLLKHSALWKFVLLGLVVLSLKLHVSKEIPQMTVDSALETFTAWQSVHSSFCRIQQTKVERTSNTSFLIHCHAQAVDSFGYNFNSSKIYHEENRKVQKNYAFELVPTLYLSVIYVFYWFSLRFL